jgi:hypothetical protein
LTPANIFQSSPIFAVEVKRGTLVSTASDCAWVSITSIKRFIAPNLIFIASCLFLCLSRFIWTNTSTSSFVKKCPVCMDCLPARKQSLQHPADLIDAYQWRHDTQHNGIQNNDTPYNDVKRCDTQNNDAQYRECYVECHYADCHFLLFKLIVLVLSVTCWLSLCWVSVCWMSLCWMARRPAIVLTFNWLFECLPVQRLFLLTNNAAKYLLRP